MPSPPGILFVDLSSRTGGAERSMDELVRELAASDLARVGLVSARAGLALPCPTLGVTPVRLRSPAHPIGFARALAALAAARIGITSAIRSFSPDAIVANGTAAALATPRSGKWRTLWHVRDMARSPYASIAARGSQSIVAISEPVAQSLRQSLPKHRHGKVTVVENGIDISRFPFMPDKGKYREALGIGRDALVVGMVANLVPWKRHADFLRTAAALRDFMDSRGRPILWIVAGRDLYGEHSRYQNELRAFARSSGIEGRVLWLENADGEDVIPALDLLVHPATSEPFGRVVCEAMASGVPVVARATGGPATIITDGETGFLAQTAEDLPSTVSSVLSHYATAREVAERARMTVERRFTARRAAMDILNLLNM